MIVVNVGCFHLTIHISGSFADFPTPRPTRKLSAKLSCCSYRNSLIRPSDKKGFRQTEEGALISSDVLWLSSAWKRNTYILISSYNLLLKIFQRFRAQLTGDPREKQFPVEGTDRKEWGGRDRENGE